MTDKEIAVFPADAGMIPERSLHGSRTGSVPRGCGDDPEAEQLEIDPHTCSPRMRG